MSKNIKRSKDERPEKTAKVLIPFRRKKTDKNGFYYWIGEEIYEVPETVLATIKEALKNYKKEDNIKEEGYNSFIKTENVTTTLPDYYLNFIMKLFEL